MSPTIAEIFGISASGFIISLGLLMTIGAQNVWLLNKSLAGEYPWVLGSVCFLLDASLITIGVYTIGHIQDLVPQLVPVVTFLGAIFLASLSAQAFFRAWYGRSQLTNNTGIVHSGPWQIAGQALAINLLNPHVYLDTVILIGGIGAQQASPLAFIIGAAGASALWFYSLTFGARLFRSKLCRPQHWQVIDGMTAICLMVLATLLLQQL